MSVAKFARIDIQTQALTVLSEHFQLEIPLDSGLYGISPIQIEEQM
jgi:hypothetical protein